MRGARPERALDLHVKRYVTIEPGKTVLAACSGGPDSVALVSLLDRAARRDGFGLAVGHVDHAARASSGQDACVALSIGARLGRPVFVATLTPGDTDEATLRDRRYAALATLAQSAGAAAIATAHTAEDQTESVLLALFRGSGLDGLGGIAPERRFANGLRLLRPLLRLTHDDLREELHRSWLPYAIDPTNADAVYRRNALRPQLAALRADFPHLDRAIARCAEIVRDERAGTPRGLARRALRDRLRERGDLQDIPFERIEAALDAGVDADVYLKSGLRTGGERRER